MPLGTAATGIVCFAEGVSPALRATVTRWHDDPAAFPNDAAWFFGGQATFHGDGRTQCHGAAGWYNQDGTYVPPPGNAGASSCATLEVPTGMVGLNEADGVLSRQNVIKGNDGHFGVVAVKDLPGCGAVLARSSRLPRPSCRKDGPPAG